MNIRTSSRSIGTMSQIFKIKMQKNKTKTIYQIKTIFVILIVFCSFAVFNTSFAQSFMGPSCSAGQCQGKIGVDSSGNMSVGTSNPQSGTRTLIISQTSDSSSYGLRVLSSNNSPLLLVRSDGKISIATSGASYALNVSGDIYASGNLVVGGTFSAPIPAGNVTPGVFNSLQGGGTGAYAFLGSLGVATSSQVGLPQTLSVYGGGYFSGNVGIGTTTPAGLLDVGGGQLVVTSSGNVGIGTTNPVSGYKMTINGDLILGTATTYNSSMLRVGYIAGVAGAGGSLNLRPGLSSGVVIFSNSGGSELVRITSGGNVGIGTTTPTALLHIASSTSAIINLEKTGTNANVSYITNDGELRIVSGRNLYLQSAAGMAIYFRKGTTEVMRIPWDSNNVGIGTTSPAYKLDVVGQINSSGGLCIAGDCKTSWSQVGGSSQWTNTTGGIYYLGNVGIGTSAVSYPLFVSTSTDALFAIQRTGASSPTIFKQGTDSAFVINNGGSDVLTIKSGNVGIGTTNPAYRLDVSGTANTARLKSGEATTYLYLENSNGKVNSISLDAYGNIYVGGAGENRTIYIRGTGGGWGTIATFQGSTGNVGIGTTTPAYKLDVVGDIRATGSLFGNFAGTVPASNVTAGVFGAGNFAFPSSLGIATSSQVGLPQSLSVYGGGYFSGNVGIGTTAPIANLHVIGQQLVKATSTYAGVFTVQNNEGYDILRVNTNNNGSILDLRDRTWGPNNILQLFDYNFNTLAVFNDTGSLGIGTTNPYSLLEVAGVTTTANYQLTLSHSSGGGSRRAGLNLRIDATNLWQIIADNSDSNKLKIGYNDLASIPLVIDTNGNVGIGTTNPLAKLDVNGLSGGLGIRVQADDGNGLSTTRPRQIVIHGSTNPNLKGEIGYDTTLKALVIGALEEGVAWRNIVLANNGGNVGIGTTSPAYKLDVASGGSATARFGSTSTDTVVIGGGAGKLTVGTVDPVYSISGKKYATYGPESIGVKVEHTGVLKLVLNKNRYEGVLDFKNAKEGDDLWLFAKTTNLASNFDKLTIQLTPAFKGKVWYNKDKENMIVKIYGEADELNTKELEVSYSLSAPRFDFEKWPNYSNDETVEGIKIY